MKLSEASRSLRDGVSLGAFRYISVLMQQAKIYWDRDNYLVVEKIFHRSCEFCADEDAWRLNVAHTLFVQENKYREAAGFYEPLVKKKYDNVSGPSPGYTSRVKRPRDIR